MSSIYHSRTFLLIGCCVCFLQMIYSGDLSQLKIHGQEVNLVETSDTLGLVARFFDGKKLIAKRLANRLVVGQHVLEPSLLSASDRLEFRGSLEVLGSGEYQFAVKGNVHCEMLLENQTILKNESNDKEVWTTSKSTKLEFGFSPVRFVVYLNKNQTAKSSVYWKGPDFGWEPLP